MTSLFSPFYIKAIRTVTKLAKKFANEPPDNTSFATTLYAAFNRLSKNGDIEAYPGAVTNGKPRTYYRITSSGQTFLAVKAAEWRRVKTVVDLFLNQPLTDL